MDFSGGMADGQLVIDRRGYDTADSTVQVVYDMDAEKTKKLLLDLLKKAK